MQKSWTVNALGEIISYLSLIPDSYTKMFMKYYWLLEVNRNEIRQILDSSSSIRTEHGTWVGFPGGSEVERLPAMWRPGVRSWSENPLKEAKPTPLLFGKVYMDGGLIGYNS